MQTKPITSISYKEPDGLDYVLLGLFVLFTLSYGLLQFALSNYEAINAEVAREMLATGNYLVPQINFMPYLRDPPFFYWLLVLARDVFPAPLFALRIVSVILGLITLAGVMWFCWQQQWRRIGVLACLILASSLGFVFVAHVVSNEMLVVCLATIVMLSFLRWYQSQRKLWLWGFYTALGLLILSQGFASAFAIVCTVLLFLLSNAKRLQRLPKLFNLFGIGLLLVVTLPWFVLIMKAEPHFIAMFFKQESLWCLFGECAPKQVLSYYHWFYLPLILLSFFPWCLLLPVLFFPQVDVNKQQLELNNFLWLWLLVPLLLFFISPAQGWHNAVMGLPPFAFLLAFRIDDYLRERRARPLLRVFGIALAVAIISLAAVEVIVSKQPQQLQALESFFAIEILILMIYGMVGIIVCFFSHKRPIIPLVLIAGLMVPIVFASLQEVQDSQHMFTEYALVKKLQRHQQAARHIFVYRKILRYASVIYYAQQRVVAISPDRNAGLLQGELHPDNGWSMNLPEFAAYAADHPVYVFVQRRRVTKFRMRLPKTRLCVLGQTARVVLLSNTQC